MADITEQSAATTATATTAEAPSTPIKSSTASSSQAQTTPVSLSAEEAIQQQVGKDFLHSGWLGKQPFHQKNPLQAGRFQRRFFVLTLEALSYSKSNKVVAGKESTKWPLKDIEEVQVMDEFLRVEVQVGKEKRSVLLKGTPETVKEWADKLTNAGVKLVRIEKKVVTFEKPAPVSPPVATADATTPAAETTTTTTTTDQSALMASPPLAEGEESSKKSGVFQSVGKWFEGSFKFGSGKAKETATPTSPTTTTSAGVETPAEVTSTTSTVPETIPEETTPVEVTSAENQEPKGEEQLALTNKEPETIPEWPVATALPESGASPKEEVRCGWFFNVFSSCMSEEDSV